MIRLFVYRKNGTYETLEVETVKALFDEMYRSDVTNAFVDLDHATFIESIPVSVERAQSRQKAAELASANNPTFEFMNRTGVYAMPGDRWRLSFDRVVAQGQRVGGPQLHGLNGGRG